AEDDDRVITYGKNIIAISNEIGKMEVYGNMIGTAVSSDANTDHLLGIIAGNVHVTGNMTGTVDGISGLDYEYGSVGVVVWDSTVDGSVVGNGLQCGVSPSDLTVGGDLIGISTNDTYYGAHTVGGVDLTNWGRVEVAGDIIGQGNAVGINLYCDSSYKSWFLSANNIIGTGNTGFSFYTEDGQCEVPTIQANNIIGDSTTDSTGFQLDNERNITLNVSGIYYCAKYKVYYPLVPPIHCMSGCSCACTDNSQCTGETPLCSGGVCSACSGSTPYWNGSACVASCPNNKPYLDGSVCVTVCPTDKPYLNGTTCVDECPAEKAYSYNGRCIETCPADTVIDGNKCVSGTPDECQSAMTTAGFSTDNFTMDGYTIKYTGDMTVATDLDISSCNLDVSGALNVNEGKTLKALNVSANSSTTEGVYNAGTIKATGLTGKTTASGECGIHNNGFIDVGNGSVLGTSIDHYGISNYNGSDGRISAVTITGNSPNGTGILNATGVLTAKTLITGTGKVGINNFIGTIDVVNGDVIGTGTTGSGVSNSGTITTTEGTVKGTSSGFTGNYITGYITANSIEGVHTGTINTRKSDSAGILIFGTVDVTTTAKGTGMIGMMIAEKGNLETATGTITGEGTEAHGLQNDGILTATDGLVSGTSILGTGLYNNGTLTARKITGDRSGTTGNTTSSDSCGIVVKSGTVNPISELIGNGLCGVFVSDTGSILSDNGTIEGTGKNIVGMDNEGIVTITNGQIKTIAETGSALRSSGTLTAKTITGERTSTTGNFTDNLGTSDDCAVSITGGKITTTSSLTGTGYCGVLIDEGAQLETDTGTITGTGMDLPGMLVKGTLMATNGTVSGTSNSHAGVYIEGMFTAKNIIGKHTGTTNTQGLSNYGIGVVSGTTTVGSSMDGSGIGGITVLSSGMVKTSAGTIKGTGTTSRGIENQGTITATNGTVSGISTSNAGINSSGTLTAKTMTGKHTSASGSNSSDSCGFAVIGGTTTVTETMSGSGYCGIMVGDNGKLETSTGTITGTGTDLSGVHNQGSLIATNGTVSGTATNASGVFSASEFTVNKIIGKHTGTTVSGTVGDFGVSIASGTTTVKSSVEGSGIGGVLTTGGTLKTDSGSITGTGTELHGVHNQGSLIATNGTVSGTSSGQTGIYSMGTLTAKTITGKHTGTSGTTNAQNTSFYGVYVAAGTTTATSSLTGTGVGGIWINTSGKFTSTSGSVSGSGTNGCGIIQYGSVSTGGTITGTSSNVYGLYLGENTTTKGGSIYYCKTKFIPSTASVTPTPQCKSGCSCSN
ncbi:MAG: hypothetical protein IKZ02_03640, partial [Alphaproteobacteria bacterium]|nr:hypothetical protein [Alphaproteobacteria bacterium]